MKKDVMKGITVYQQRRVDGGTRTGLSLDGQTVAELFVEGGRRRDPVLRWFVDVRCSGSRLPITVSHAIRWLLENGDTIKRGLASLRDHLRGSFDYDSLPVIQNVDGAPAGTKIAVAFEAVQAVSGKEIVSIIDGFSEAWEKTLARLDATVADGAVT